MQVGNPSTFVVAWICSEAGAKVGMIALVDTSSWPCSAGKTGNCQRIAVPACRWPQRLPHSQYSGFGANLSKCIRGSDRESAYVELLRARRCSSVMCAWPGNQSGAGMNLNFPPYPRAGRLATCLLCSYSLPTHIGCSQQPSGGGGA